MTGPWWGKDVDPHLAAEAADESIERDKAATVRPRGEATRVREPAPPHDPRLPHLVDTEPAAIVRGIEARRAGFTPTWTSRRPDDPGNALIAVYAEQHAVVASAIDDLPTKARVEHLRAAGVVRRAPRPLRAMLMFEVSQAAPQGVLVGEGFEVLGRDDETGAQVPFETTRDMYAAPATLAVLGRRTGGSVASLTLPTPDLTSTTYPFGLAPKPGVAVYLGLSATVAPSPQLAIGVVLAGRGGPAPVSAGGLFPQPGAETPRLAWELYDGRSFVAAEVIRDDTRSFTQSGVIELRIPSGWQPGTPPGADANLAPYWIRGQLLDGAWPAPPAIAFVGLNMVPAQSGRTVRDEILETPTAPDPDKRRVLTTGERPVLEATIDVRIDEGGAELVPWTPVDDLSQAGPDDRVFRFDAATGTLTFGDERSGHGRPLPEGFRHVRATYRTTTQARTIAAGAISTLIGSAPFLTTVTNLEPAAGGAETETLAQALLRGPREIRARNRAVAVADYEVLALQAPGADIRRAHAVAGLHPRFPGRPLPGVVAVFVVGAARRDGQPPVPTEATLQGVSDHLTSWAPRGVEVVAVAPRFHRIRIEASLELRRDAKVTETIYATSRALDRWFDPIIGATGEGWPFGGTIRHDALVRFILRELAGAVLAIPYVAVVLDDRRYQHCEDVVVPAHELLWPAPHELRALATRRSS